MPNTKINFYSQTTSVNRIILLTLVVLFGVVSTYITFSLQRPKPSDDVVVSKVINRTLIYGTADPDSVLLLETNIQYDHIFVPWGPTHLVSSGKKLAKLRTERNLLITIEPYKEDKNEDLISKTLNGKYDSTITELCDLIQSQNKKTIIRFAHEMDTNNSLYPWSNQDPAQYIKFFQYFVSLCRTKAPLAQYMWSPNGEKKARDYYPGNEYVDIVGLSAYGYPQYEEKSYGKILSFDDMFEKKYNQVAVFGKKIFVAEFGVTGSPEYQSTYLSDAYKSMKSNPKYTLLTGFIYFYYFNPTPWIPGIDKPDYRLDVSNLRNF